MIKIVFTGGGTGGHIFPLIAITREMRNLLLGQEYEFIYIGPNEPDWGIIALSHEGFAIKTIYAGKIRRYFSWKNFKDIFKTIFGIIQSIFYLWRIKPKLVFSKGGYGSMPVVIASWMLKIPVFLHESDVVPGLANRIASRFAKKIFTSFPKTEYFKLEETIFVGNPIRKEILQGSKSKAKEIFGLTFEKPIITILGGSQGSQKINDFILLILPQLLQKYEVVHQCGMNKIEQVKKEVQVIIDKELEKFYHPVGFLNEEETKHLLAGSDLIISRAGSGAIFEIAALSKPSILIPLAGSAGNHQAKNALYYAQIGACEVIEEENLTPNFFLNKLNYIFREETKKRMSESASKFAKPDAAKIIAREILEYIRYYG